MDNKVRVMGAPAPEVVATTGGANGILWVLTGDLVAGYQAITAWLEGHKSDGWAILSMSVNPVQLNSPIQGANVTGFGITVILKYDEYTLADVVRSINNLTTATEGI
jgi:hypothetical protein